MEKATKNDHLKILKALHEVESTDSVDENTMLNLLEYGD